MTIDCDIHPGVPSVKVLLPYMDPYWADAFVQRGMDGFDMASYPPGAPISCRPDWRLERAKPGTSLAQLHDNLGALELQLDDELLAEIQAVHRRTPNPAP